LKDDDDHGSTLNGNGGFSHTLIHRERVWCCRWLSMSWAWRRRRKRQCRKPANGRGEGDVGQRQRRGRVDANAAEADDDHAAVAPSPAAGSASASEGACAAPTSATARSGPSSNCRRPPFKRSNSQRRVPTLRRRMRCEHSFVNNCQINIAYFHQTICVGCPLLAYISPIRSE